MAHHRSKVRQRGLRGHAFGGDVVERQDLVFTDLLSGESVPVHLEGDRPGHVIAAAHLLSSPRALVLDHVPPARDRGAYDRSYHDDHEHVRLLLVDLQNATSRVVARFPWAARFDQHALVTLPNGDSVLVASSSTSHRHSLVRFRLNTSRRGDVAVQILAVAEGEGAVMAPPIASIEGVSIAAQPRDRGWTAIGYELPIPTHPPSRGLDAMF